MANEVTLANVNDVLRELEEAYYDIPFENSDFQTRNFVIASQITPERAYRAIGLRIFNRIRALKEAMYERKLEDIDIEEMRAKINDPNIDEYERRRLEIKIQQKLDNRSYIDKLINDAIHECNVLYAEFKKFPKFTREQFEAGEYRHFDTRLQRQLHNVVGAAESLVNMKEDAKQLTLQLQLLSDASS